MKNKLRLLLPITSHSPNSEITYKNSATRTANRCKKIYAHVHTIYIYIPAFENQATVRKSCLAVGPTLIIAIASLCYVYVESIIHRNYENIMLQTHAHSECVPLCIMNICDSSYMDVGGRNPAVKMVRRPFDGIDLRL